MASNTSTESVPSSLASITNASSILPSSPFAISVSNIKNLVPTVLDYTNYILWRELFLSVFKGHGIYGFIDGIFLCPEPTILHDDARSLLFLHEAQLNSLSNFTSDNSTTAFMAKQQSSHSYGRGRGRHNNGGCHSNGGRGQGRYTQGNTKSFNVWPQQFTPRPRLPSILGPPPISYTAAFNPSQPNNVSLYCQLCYQPYHTARDYPSLNSKAFVSDISSNNSFSSPGDASWFVDSGVSFHMTPNTTNLSSITPHNGSDHVVVSNGTQLPISYTGHGIFSTSDSLFSLRDILVVPHLSTNLPSELKTKRPLLRCNSSGPLYALTSSSDGFVATCRLALVAAHVFPNLWNRIQIRILILPKGIKLLCQLDKTLLTLLQLCNNVTHDSPPNVGQVTTSSTPNHTISRLPITTTNISPIQRLESSVSQPQIPHICSSNTKAHHMITRKQTCSLKPHILPSLISHISSLPPELTSFTEAHKLPHWRRALAEEYNAFIANRTCDLVPASPTANVIGCRWVYRIKQKSDSSLEHFKARLVAQV
uniref:Retrovirus-related Pol polyprotein from transposon TNT 1-94-like beta-barrel domain-containing protein n=1 Tax=Nicotiana tabacum TaxID=4097 RepID=A0A1S3ZHY7_TOBAC|nr:PREDICTED: uncharacterized protein LOC107787044 [Nicotiana tabacum]